jgi:RNA-directed DNA polymerase
MLKIIPLMITSSNKWYLCMAQETSGPYEEKLICSILADHKETEQVYIWTSGMKDWQKIENSKFGKMLDSKFDEPEKMDLGEKLSWELEREYESKPWLKRVAEVASSMTKKGSAKSLSDWTRMPEKELIFLGEQANQLYNPFPIQGKRKKRWIEAPDEKLKAVQRMILDNLLRNIPLSGAAHGFVPNRSILTHASNHRRKRWVVTLDIRSFFPSVNEEMVREVARELPIPSHEIELFVQLTTRNNHLPQGAPTSPAIGNLVLKALDEQLCDEVRGTGWFYSRYADDLTFSGFKNPQRMLQVAKRYIKEAGFFVSEEKCRIRGKNQRQMVTGIVVNDKLALCNEKRNMVRAMKHRLSNGLVPAEEMPHVMGWINFSNYVEHCNISIPRRGPSVRQRRLSLSQMFENHKNYWDSVFAGNFNETGVIEMAKRTGISVSAIRRFHDSSYCDERIRNAKITELNKVDLFTSFGLHGIAMHDLAKCGRLFDLELSGCEVSDLLRIRLGPEGSFETVLSLAIASKDEDFNWNHPLLNNKESLIRNAEAIEKIAKLVYKEEEELALDLALGFNSVDILRALLDNYGADHPYPNWIYFPNTVVDKRSFYFKLLCEVGKMGDIAFESPLCYFAELDFSEVESIQNLDFLWGCTKLTRLNLSNCSNLENINGLSECPNLTILKLDGCDKIKDFSPISELSFLNELSARNQTGTIRSVDGAEACRQAWAYLGSEDEFDEYQFEYTGTIASSQRYLIFSDQKFTISVEHLKELEESIEAVYEEDWFSPIKKLLEATCEKWGPSLCVKINNRWVAMGFYSW